MFRLILLTFALLLSSCGRYAAQQARVSPPVASPAAAPGDAEGNEDGEHETGSPAADWNRARREPSPGAGISLSDAQAAFAQLSRMPRKSASPRAATFNAGPVHGGWTSLGPGAIGGRTRALLIHPTDPNTMYAAAVTGGIWKSTDAGQHWIPLTDGLPNLTFSTLAFDPKDPKVIYAGQGERYAYFSGLGIVKTTDGGNTWNYLPATLGKADFAYVNRIVVSTVNSQHLYVATDTGLLSTKDGGVTWTRAPLSADFYGCVDLVARTDTPTDTLFAACSSVRSSDAGFIWRNTDAGGAGVWTKVLSPANMGRAAIGIAPSNPAVVYVAAAGIGSNPQSDQGYREGSGLAGLYRSAANGDLNSWSTQTSSSDPNPFNALILSYGSNFAPAYCANGTPIPADVGYGSWGMFIAVDPLNPDIVWAGNSSLHRSDDGGRNWGVAEGWYSVPNLTGSHSDRHGLIFANGFNGTTNQTIFHITDGGIYRSDNARAAVSTGPRAGCQTEYVKNTSLTWTQLNTDYSTNQFWRGAAYPGGQYFMGGLQDNGIVRGAETGFNSWTTLGGGDGEAVAVDPVDPARILFSSQLLSLRRSVDGGANIGNAVNGITEPAGNFPFSAVLAIDPNDTNNVYIGGSQNLWRSPDWAANWTASGDTGGGTITAIAVSPFDSNVVLFGTRDGFIFAGSNVLTGAGNWSSVRPRSAIVASLAFDPSTPGRVYAIYSNTLNGNKAAAHVYRSNDGGKTWAVSDGAGSTALPDSPSYTLLVNPATPSTLYLGTDLGLMISTDAGATWAHDDTLPGAVADDLAFDSPQANYLFVFTHGRGVWRAPLPAAHANCTFLVSPTDVVDSGEGGTYAIAVTTQDGCAWSAIPTSGSQQFSVQSPARGVGSGAVFVNVAANLNPGAASATLSVATQSVTARQAALLTHVGSDVRANAPLAPIPSLQQITIRNFTSDGADPVHSCTGSADFGTAWWRVTPTVSGFLNVQGRGDRLDVFGNSGIVITAYANSAPNSELACTRIPRDTTARTLAGFQIPVVAGETYTVEIAALDAAGLNTNYNLVLSMGTAPAAISVTAAQAAVYTGSNGTQLSAAVTGPLNTSVRWSLTPAVGRVSQTGRYTPPPTVGVPTPVAITATSFADGAKSATAVVTVVPPGTVWAPAAGLVSAASYRGQAVAPGQIVTLFGLGFGPSALAGAIFDASGNLTKAAGNTTIRFDGVAAPVIYSVNGQMSAIVPYSVAGKASTQMQVLYNGQSSTPVAVPVVSAAPGLFTADASGTGNAASLNQDYSLNSAATPAAKGSVVVLFGTGEGQTIPAGVDGLGNKTSFPSPALPVQISIGGVNAKIAYFGAAPSLVSGVFQANVYVPDNAPSGNLPVIVTVGGISSPAGVTVAVK